MFTMGPMHLNKFSSILSNSIELLHNNSLSRFIPLSIKCRGCSLLANAKETPSLRKKKNDKKTINKKSGKKEALKEESETSVTIDDLTLFIKGKKKKRCSYVFEESLAERLVRSIQCNRLNPTAPLLEIAPGPGFVSKAFLNHGVDQVIAVETEKYFYSFLQAVQKEYGSNRFEYLNWNILSMYEKFNDCPPRENGLTYKQAEAVVVKRFSTSASFNTDVPYSVFTIGGNRENHDSIFYILRHLPNEDPIVSRGRIEFFFLMHPKFKFTIEGIFPTNEASSYSRYYSYIYTFMSLFYDFLFIDEFDANEFVPAFTKTGVTRNINPQKRHLMKLQLKEDVSKILPLDQHYAFSIFLRHLFRKRKIRIVPVMEMLVTGSGLQMLLEGFTMMETVADVSPQRLLQLYKSMLNWPEYSVSHLKNHIVMKTQGGPMEDEDL